MLKACDACAEMGSVTHVQLLCSVPVKNPYPHFTR